jgi:hypothetical protein
VAIALDAWIGGAPGNVIGDKVVYHPLLKVAGNVHNIKWNVQDSGYLLSIVLGIE